MKSKFYPEKTLTVSCKNNNSCSILKRKKNELFSVNLQTLNMKRNLSWIIYRTNVYLRSESEREFINSLFDFFFKPNHSLLFADILLQCWCFSCINPTDNDRRYALQNPGLILILGLYITVVNLGIFRADPALSWVTIFLENLRFYPNIIYWSMICMRWLLGLHEYWAGLVVSSSKYCQFRTLYIAQKI